MIYCSPSREADQESPDFLVLSETLLEGRMNKKELVEAMAGAADISKASAEKALNGMLIYLNIMSSYPESLGYLRL